MARSFRTQRQVWTSLAQGATEARLRPDAGALSAKRHRLLPPHALHASHIDDAGARGTLERQHWRLYAKAYKVFSLGLGAWPFRRGPWWKVYRFRVFTGGWLYHDVQLLFCRYTAWFALLCSEQAAADALELLRHHRMIPGRHIKLIRSLARQGPNEQLRAVAEVIHQDMLEGMEEEGLTDDLEDPFA